MVKNGPVNFICTRVNTLAEKPLEFTMTHGELSSGATRRRMTDDVCTEDGYCAASE